MRALVDDFTGESKKSSCDHNEVDMFYVISVATRFSRVDFVGRPRAMSWP